MMSEEKCVSHATAQKLYALGFTEHVEHYWWGSHSVVIFHDEGGLQDNYIPAPDTGELIKALHTMCNEIAIGYNDSGCFWHVRIGDKGAGDMIREIGKRFDGCDLDDNSLVETLALAWILAKQKNTP